MIQNVGAFDAHLRISAGLTMLGIGVMKPSKLMILIGSMMAAEGITRFCPMLYLLGVSSKSLDEKMSEEPTEIPINNKGPAETPVNAEV